MQKFITYNENTKGEFKAITFTIRSIEVTQALVQQKHSREENKFNVKSKKLLCMENILKLLHHFTDLLSLESKDFLFSSKKNIINN